MDGCELPNKNRPFPFSQIVSIFASESERSFLAWAAPCGFTRRPNKGASLALKTYGADTSGTKKTSSNENSIINECTMALGE